MQNPTDALLGSRSSEWKAEQSLWLHDVDRMCAEAETARAGLETIDQLLLDLGRMIADHGRVVRVQAEEFARRELAEAAPDSGVELTPLIRSRFHSGTRDPKLVGLRKRHDWICRHHRAVLDQLRGLIVTLERGTAESMSPRLR